MILSGEPIGAEAAVGAGAIDRVVGEGDDLLAAAVAHARAMVAAEDPAVRTRDRDAALGTGDGGAILAARRADLVATDPEEVAGLAAIDAMIVGLRDGFDAGLAAERAAFVALRDSPRAAAKREAFFAARRKPSA
jgi:3-hydroxyacyl-CoA dehydrogenase